MCTRRGRITGGLRRAWIDVFGRDGELHVRRVESADGGGDGGERGWGQSFGYDGFGNLTTKAPTKGSVPVLSVSFDGLTNRGGGSYDANGNNLWPGGFPGATYDVENRMIGQTLNGLHTRGCTIRVESGCTSGTSLISRNTTCTGLGGRS